MSSEEYVWLRPKHAEQAGVFIGTIRNWIKRGTEVDGKVLGFKAGGRYKINPRLLQRLVEGPLDKG